MVKTNFEREFTELISKMVSLGLELPRVEVDEVYIYGSMEKSTTSFNGFFRIGDEIKTTKWVTDSQKDIFNFLDLGLSDLDDFITLFKRYNNPVPTELKLRYNVHTNKFEISYKYEPVCTSKTGLTSHDVLYAWIEEEQQKLR